MSMKQNGITGVMGLIKQQALLLKRKADETDPTNEIMHCLKRRNKNDRRLQTEFVGRTG